MYNDCYFVNVNNCSSELLDKYKENNDISIRTSSKSKKVKQINILTKQETIYKSMTEATIKFGSTHKSISDAIKNNSNIMATYGNTSSLVNLMRIYIVSILQ